MATAQWYWLIGIGSSLLNCGEKFRGNVFLRATASRLYCHPSSLRSLWICNIPKRYPDMISAVLLLSALNPIQHFTEKKKKPHLSLWFRCPQQHFSFLQSSNFHLQHTFWIALAFAASPKSGCVLTLEGARLPHQV